MAHFWVWNHSGEDDDIIAYRLMDSRQQPVKPKRGEGFRMSEWIKCSEKYPGPQEWVLVYAKWANQQVICWDNISEKWTDFDEQTYHKEMFSHWQPLPPPPEDSCTN